LKTGGDAEHGKRAAGRATVPEASRQIADLAAHLD
jgi:hypothetical protein